MHRALLVSLLLLPAVAGAARADEVDAGPGETFLAAAFDAQDRLLVLVSTGEGAVALRTTGADARTLWSERSDEARVHLLAGAPDGDVLLAGVAMRGGGEDVLVVRLRPDGGAVWTSTFDAGGEDAPTALTVDATGAAVLVGASGNAFGVDAFAARVNAGGQVSWTRVVARAPVDELLAVAVAPDGSIVAGGRSVERARVDALLLGYDAAGAPTFALTYDEGTVDEVLGLDAFLDGSVVLSGTRVDADGAHHWLARHAPDGTLAWERTLPGAGGPVRVTPEGGVVALAEANGASWLRTVGPDGTPLATLPSLAGASMDLAADGRVAVARGDAVATYLDGKPASDAPLARTSLRDEPAKRPGFPLWLWAVPLALAGAAFGGSALGLRRRA